MKIYEIDEAIRKALDESIDEDGVINEAAFSIAFELGEERNKKILGFAKYLKEQEAEIAAMKDAEKRIAARRKSLENACERSKNYLVGLIDKPVKDADIAISKRRSERLIIEDEDEFIATYAALEDIVVRKISKSIDKRMVSQEIKAGEDFNGAYIEEHYSLQIK